MKVLKVILFSEIPELRVMKVLFFRSFENNESLFSEVLKVMKVCFSEVLEVLKN